MRYSIIGRGALVCWALCYDSYPRDSPRRGNRREMKELIEKFQEECRRSIRTTLSLNKERFELCFNSFVLILARVLQTTSLDWLQHCKKLHITMNCIEMLRINCETPLNLSIQTSLPSVFHFWGRPSSNGRPYAERWRVRVLLFHALFRAEQWPPISPLLLRSCDSVPKGVYQDTYTYCHNKSSNLRRKWSIS